MLCSTPVDHLGTFFRLPVVEQGRLLRFLGLVKDRPSIIFLSLKLLRDFPDFLRLFHLTVREFLAYSLFVSKCRIRINFHILHLHIVVIRSSVKIIYVNNFFFCIGHVKFSFFRRSLKHFFQFPAVFLEEAKESL